MDVPHVLRNQIETAQGGSTIFTLGGVYYDQNVTAFYRMTRRIGYILADPGINHLSFSRFRRLDPQRAFVLLYHRMG